MFQLSSEALLCTLPNFNLKYVTIYLLFLSSKSYWFWMAKRTRCFTNIDYLRLNSQQLNQQQLYMFTI